MREFKLKFLLVCAIVLLMSAAPVTLGDWDVGDGHKMHYPQLPKPGGWDVAFNFGRLADDWQCSQTGPVEDIHFWVSWEMDMVQPITGFSVRIWSDDPCGPNNYSEPNVLLWEREFYAGEFTVRDMNDDWQGWFDPFTDYWAQIDHFSWQQVNIEDINDPNLLIQEEGKIYWLEIDMWGAEFCGWKESGSPHFRDDAVFWDSPDWTELRDPNTLESLDLAFVITGTVQEVVKWEQPPCLDDPCCMDVDATDDDWWWWAPQALADDFNCTKTGLITDIHIWGSWYYDDPPPPDGDPNYVWFTLCIYSNDPCGPMGWSEPNELLWTKEFHEGQFDVEVFAEGPEAYYVPCEPAYFPDSDWICWQYDFYIDPCEAFVQEEGTIYWLALQAHIYEPDLMFEYRFGWKNSSEQWNDDAVWAVGLLPDDFGPGAWNELLHPMSDESVDLAFAITTEAEPCEPNEPGTKWVQLPDMDFGVDQYSVHVGDAVCSSDFECTSPNSVLAVRWWGSYLDGTDPGDGPNFKTFELVFHYDVPAGMQDPETGETLTYSHPTNTGPDGWLYYEHVSAEERYYGTTVGGEKVYEYITDLNEPFDQEYWKNDPCNPVPGSGIFWLDIGYVDEVNDPPVIQWGWHESVDNRIDLSISNPNWHGGPWANVTVLDKDLAFVIITELEEEPLPGKPLAKHVKWSQPPIEIDPTSRTPIYCGWDQPSHREVMGFDIDCWGPNCPCQCLGDATCDGVINVFDFMKLKMALGTIYGDAFYDACADFDRNLVVNHADVQILHENYGFVCPPGFICPEYVSPGGQAEYWDFFAVSLSPDGVYWDLVNGGNGALSDPLVSPDPAGASVIDSATPLGGVAWGFGGADWSDGILEGDANTYSIELMGESNYYLSVVLDTSTTPQADGYVPSWGTISNIVVRPWDAQTSDWGDPCVPNWVLSPFDPDAGTVVNADGNSVTLAINDFGSSDMVAQAGGMAGIWGAAAELPPAAGYKVEFTTDVNTWDSYDGTGPQMNIPWDIVADDFRCFGPMPVTSVHWWGSHVGWEGPGAPPLEPVSWRIGFWSNVPADPFGDPNYSYPRELLWQIEVPASRVEVNEVGTDEFHGMYPSDTCYQYYVDLEPNEVFWQGHYLTEDDTYWLSIAAIYPFGSPPLDYPWGWKTRPWSWMDDAVTFWVDSDPQPGLVLGPWSVEPIEDPIFGESFDVTFELDTDPNYIKWEQPYTGFRHWRHYEDEESMGIDDDMVVEPNIIRLVADDWPCDDNKPVVAAAWWGSYIGYGYEACQGPVEPPTKPDYFLLSVWTDVPADVDLPYSHPGEKIWEYAAYDYDEVLVGYDKHPHGAPNEPVFRYSVGIPKEDWFCQNEPNNIYWFSVVAVYYWWNETPYPWGWTNRAHGYEDDAVAGVLDTGGAAPTWIWEELHDQTEANSVDMSFILFTEPDCFPSTDPKYAQWLLQGKPRAWCCSHQRDGDATGDGKTNVLDLFCVKKSYGKKWATDPHGTNVGEYNCCADFNHDGGVNVLDLFIVKQNYGTLFERRYSCPWKDDCGPHPCP